MDEPQNRTSSNHAATPPSPPLSTRQNVNGAHDRPHPAPAGEAAIHVQGVSRWYGEILGINRVTVDIHPGITGLVGPNGSGKSTLMNIVCGLLRPGQGAITVLGMPVWNNPELMRHLGYCSQVDHFYESFTGRQFVETMLSLHGRGGAWTRRTAAQAIDMVGMGEHQHRRLRAYSKGMRQRVKIALSLAHQPEILILDEPFNGLDPVGRREMMELFADYARQGRTIVLSSHILHEIEQMTDHILMMSNGYVLAEGQVTHVRDLLRAHPFQVFLRCAEPRRLASLMIAEPSVISIQVEGEDSLTLMTRDPDAFYLRLNDVVIHEGIDIDLVTLADENVQSIYHYLAGKEHH